MNAYARNVNKDVINAFFPQINFFREVVVERLLPAFADLEVEAEEKGQQSTTEHEYENVIDWFIGISQVKQSMINLYAVGLRHLFEQQFYYLANTIHRDWERKADFNKDKSVVIDASGINIESFDSWRILKELGLVCNAVKHAEGHSVKNLVKIRPDLLEDPMLLDMPNINFSGQRLAVQMPLSGEGIYIQEKDIEEYMNAVEGFWREFVEILEA